MRAVEIGIKAIYLCLGLPDPIGRERNWGNLTNGVRTAIENKGSSWPKRDFFFELSGTIVAVKDAWRKNTMHVEISYTEQDAERIFTYVGLFIDKLSAQMDEAGLPLA